MLRPMPIEAVPPGTARVARAAFPKGHRYLRLAEELETLFTDNAFLVLFPTHGQPTRPPWRLAFATILQFVVTASPPVQRRSHHGPGSPCARSEAGATVTPAPPPSPHRSHRRQVSPPVVFPWDISDASGA